jgi:hypothetical protein
MEYSSLLVFRLLWCSPLGIIAVIINISGDGRIVDDARLYFKRLEKF